MENQGKRLLLAVVLALGIVLVWNFLFPPAKPKPGPKPDEIAEKKVMASPVGVPAGATEAPEAPAGPEDITTFEFANLRIELSNRDAKVVSWKLLDPKYEHDWNKGEMIADPGLGALGVNFYKSPIVIPRGARWVKTPDAQEKANEATYTFDSPDLHVVKTFHIHPDTYLIDMQVSVALKSLDGKPRALDQQLAVQMVGHQDPKAPTKSARTVRALRAACLINGSVRQIDAKKLERDGPVEVGGEVRWVGFNHPYLFFAVSPNQQDNHGLACNTYPVDTVPGGMEVDLVYKPVHLDSTTGEVSWKTSAFIGPKHLDALEDADDIEGYSTGFAKSVNLGWFSIIARPLLSVLIWFHGFVGNWGIAIILLTICVKLATLYWTTKSMRSMKAMAALKPKMDELQKKYGDDRQKIQQEMMGIYKAHGVNPLSGCLPMLLQMPIWLALYKMLSSAGELYLAPFIPGWIDDLTATDPYHILPVVLMGMMFLQSRMSPATVDNFQQKMMIYGLPLIFGVMSFFFPAGLTIYILTNTTLSLLHSLYMKKWDKGVKLKVPVAAAAKPAASKPAAKPLPSRSSDDSRGDVEAEEVEDEDDDEGDDEEPAMPAAAPQRTQQRSNAPRRKRKRKH